MARISISEAARRGYAARMTIYRAIKDGRLTQHLEGQIEEVDPPDEAEFVTGHDRDQSRAPPDAPGYREIALPEDDPERLAIMTIDGEMSEADARAMMRVAPT